MKKIIVEVGSTVTKFDLYDGETLKKLKSVTIWLKKNYKEAGKLKESDINKLIEEVKEAKAITNDIYVCGTSIFRDLNMKEKNAFLDLFKKETGYDFHIISSEEENALTVKGATKGVKSKVCVCVAGGGSTEISIYDGKIIESVNSKFGVVDVMEKFPDLGDDLATSSVEEVKKYVLENLKMPTEKADILILAGGGHEYFARESGIKYEANTLYEDINSPIMMDIATRKQETERYYKEISMDEIKSRVDDPKWWFATRAMCALTLALAETIEAKYIVPTNINCSYGLIDK